MTDEQIIEGLRCCTSTTEIGCELCPYSSTVNCLLRSTQDARDLINRQKAEIERLIDLINELGDWNEAWVKDNHDLRVELKTTKAEAIKEFAERLKKRKYQSSDWSRGEHPYVVEEDDIDDVLEEMTEERQ